MFIAGFKLENSTVGVTHRLRRSAQESVHFKEMAFPSTIIHTGDKPVTFDFSRVYNRVVAVTFECQSVGNPLNKSLIFYAHAYFTFKQADGTESGTFQPIFGSSDYSAETWKSNNYEGIEIGQLSAVTYWNNIECRNLTIIESK